MKAAWAQPLYLNHKWIPLEACWMYLQEEPARHPWKPTFLKCIVKTNACPSMSNKENDDILSYHFEHPNSNMAERGRLSVTAHLCKAAHVNKQGSQTNFFLLIF